MKKLLAIMTLLACVPTLHAQSFISMGRLFTTPGERTQLDQRRNAAPLSALGPQTPGAPAALPPNVMDAASGNAAPGVPPAPAPAPIAEAAPERLQLQGLIQRSGGRSVVIVNGEVQPAPPGASVRSGVTLQADGHAVLLKPGQSYDPASGRVYEAAR